mmetsp:Transcript_89250/g.232665  ORF Transcript_89250/g.232665 Transcript_89250/m.232665 type:complete len:452 (+) Transcript_89250:475-1830(+)
MPLRGVHQLPLALLCAALSGLRGCPRRRARDGAAERGHAQAVAHPRAGCGRGDLRRGLHVRGVPRLLRGPLLDRAGLAEADGCHLHPWRDSGPVRGRVPAGVARVARQQGRPRRGPRDLRGPPAAERQATPEHRAGGAGAREGAGGPVGARRSPGRRVRAAPPADDVHPGLRRVRAQRLLLRRHVRSAAGDDTGIRSRTRLGDRLRRPGRPHRHHGGHGARPGSASQDGAAVLHCGGCLHHQLLRLRRIVHDTNASPRGGVPVRLLRLLLGAGHGLHRIRAAGRGELPDPGRHHGRQRRLRHGPLRRDDRPAAVRGHARRQRAVGAVHLLHLGAVRHGHRPPGLEARPWMPGSPHGRCSSAHASECLSRGPRTESARRRCWPHPRRLRSRASCCRSRRLIGLQGSSQVTHSARMSVFDPSSSQILGVSGLSVFSSPFVQGGRVSAKFDLTI